MDLKTIQKIINYIEENLDEELSLNDISEWVNYSPYYCSASFRKHLGSSIKNYIRKRRLQKAAESLLVGHDRLIDIAYRYGYSSQEAFSRAFSNQYGISPYRYRKERLPIMDLQKKYTMEKQEKKDLSNINKDLFDGLQDQILSNYPVEVLHVLNGKCMLEDFTKHGYFKENCTYIPFNEVMCWGRGGENLFSRDFILHRVEALKTSIEDYQKIVLEPLKPLFKKDFNTIVLWFGKDMFCQINLLSIMAYLNYHQFRGDVLLCIKDEARDQMLNEAYAVDIEGCYQIYKSVVCQHEMPKNKLMPVMYQAINLYLNYRNQSSKINRYIREHIDKNYDSLLRDLMTRFEEYGLGDLQYKMMIDEAMKK